MKKSPNEPAPVQGANAADEEPVRFIYRGPSMRPTFRPGQVLYVRPQARDIGPGDVVVFPDHKGGDFQVVHRVVSVTDKGLVTRGDNNMQNDPVPIRSDQVIGKVEKSNFQGKIRPVAGGRRGLFLARILRLTLKVRWFLRRGLSRPYQWLKRSGIVARIWRPEIESIRFETQDGPLFKYMHKGKTVARHWTQGDRWYCRLPYGLILGPKPDERLKRND